MFTTQHYTAVAKVLADQRSEATMNAGRQMHARITRALADMFTEDNDRFDRERFTRAAGLPAKHSQES